MDKVKEKSNKIINEATLNSLMAKFNAFTDPKTRKLIFYETKDVTGLHHTMLFQRPSGNSMNYLCVRFYESSHEHGGETF